MLSLSSIYSILYTIYFIYYLLLSYLILSSNYPLCINACYTHIPIYLIYTFHSILLSILYYVLICIHAHYTHKRYMPTRTLATRTHTRSSQACVQSTLLVDGSTVCLDLQFIKICHPYICTFWKKECAPLWIFYFISCILACKTYVHSSVRSILAVAGRR